MSNKDKVELDVEGRASDGWYFAVDVVGGATVRLGDHDDLRAVWARVRAAQKEDGDVFFSGCRPAEIDAEGKVSIGKLDGAGVRAAKEIVSIRNFGGSATGFAEMRLARIEEGLGAVAAAVNEIEGELDALDEELSARFPGREKEGEDEPEEPAAGAPALSVVPGGEAVSAAAQAALAQGAGEDE